MLQGGRKSWTTTSSPRRVLAGRPLAHTWCMLWEISNMGKIMDPSRLRCAWSRAGPNCLVGNARRCPAGETDLDGLMAKQLADAHENVTRQTVYP